MAHISQVTYENASEKVKKLIDEQIKNHGRITNMKLTLLHSIPSFHALMEWFPLEENILIRYGRAIVDDANNVPQEIFDDLKKHWNEEQIVAITAFATIMIATNLINKVLQVDLDDYLAAYTK